VNGKKAKMLRRIAEEMSVGIEEIKYTDRALNPRKPTRRTRFLYECGRLVYRNLKKRHKESFVQ
jgi:hypothetical protein